MPRTSRKTATKEIAPISIKWNAGLYLRLSEKDEGDSVSNSIENQQALLIDYIQGSAEIRQIDEYIDDGKTGTNFRRPSFERLLEDIKKKRINCVIVKDLSRLGRNLVEIGVVLETIFPLYGVRFIAVTDHFDSENTNAAEIGYILPIKNLLNAYYITDLSKKSKSARKVMRDNGKYIGAYPIYGYEKSEEERHCLVVDPEASEVVKWIFDMVVQGTSINRIVRHLNEQGIDAPAQYRKRKEGKELTGEYKNIWYNGTVRHILRSLIYTGTLVQGKTTVLTPKGKKAKKPKEEWSIVEHTHEPIIEAYYFEQAQQAIEKRKRQYAENYSQIKSSPNMLRGLLYCGACKKAMRRHRENKDNKFVYAFLCPTYSSGNGCSKNRILEDKLFAILFKAIKNQIELAVDLEPLMKEFVKPSLNQEHYQSDLRKLQGKLNKALLLKGSIYQDYKKGILDKEEYLYLKEKYAKQTLEIEDQFLTLQTKVLEIENRKIDFSRSISHFLKFKENEELSRELVVALVERIEVSDCSKVRIVLKYNGLWDDWKEHIQMPCQYSESEEDLI